MSGIDWKGAVQRAAEAVTDVARTTEASLRQERDRDRTDLGRLLEAAQAVAAVSHLMPGHAHHLQGVETSGCPGCAIDQLVRVQRGVRTLRSRWSR